MTQALRQRLGWLEAAVRFCTQFATAPADVSPQALAVIEAGLARGVEAPRIMRAARMLQGYELMFWDTLWAQSAPETAAGQPSGQRSAPERRKTYTA